MADSATQPTPGVVATAKTAPERKFWTFLVACLVVVVVFVVGRLLLFSGQVTTEDAQVDSHISPVAAKVSGYVSRLGIDDNSRVKEGDALIFIDPRDYQTTLDQARASFDLAKAEADRDRLIIGLTRRTTRQETSGASAQKQADTADLVSSRAQLEQIASASLSVAKANLEAKRATQERAQSDLNRYKPLLETNDISKYQYDSVATAARVAASELAAAQQQVMAAQQDVEIARANASSAEAKVLHSQAVLQGTKAREEQVPITEANLRSALANIERTKAALEQTQLNVDYCTVVAPISGQVTEKSVEVGQYVSPGQLLLTIVPLAKTYITANFKETQLAQVHPGQRARIHVDMYRRDFSGKVDSIAAATGSKQALLPPQNATGNFIKVVARLPVKILVEHANDREWVLRPGMNVEATIYTQ